MLMIRFLFIFIIGIFLIGISYSALESIAYATQEDVPKTNSKENIKGQFEYSDGVLIFKLDCKENKLFVKKSNAEHLYCLKSTTAEKLIQRGWELPSISFLTLNEQSDKQILVQFFGQCYSDIDCVISKLADFAKDHDKPKVISTFSDIVSVYEENVVYCHTPVHHLGHFFSYYLGGISNAMPYLDSRCGGALYHGVFESYFEKLNVDDLEDDAVHDICPIVENKFSRDRWECLHALGHGLMKFYGDDAISAVEHCGNLENQWALNSCARGVFMENQIQHLEFSGGTFDENDVFYPCDVVDSQYAPACYSYQAGHVLVTNSFSKIDSFEKCDTIMPKEYVKYCYRGLGKDLAHESFFDINNSLKICQLGQVQYQSDCLMGTVRVVIDHLSLEKGFQYCKAYPDEFKTDCYNLLGKWIDMISDTVEQRKAQCSISENEKYAQICMNASLENEDLI